MLLHRVILDHVLLAVDVEKNDGRIPARRRRKKKQEHRLQDGSMVASSAGSRPVIHPLEAKESCILVALSSFIHAAFSRHVSHGPVIGMVVPDRACIASIACIAKAVAVRCWFIASGGFHPSRVVPSAPRPACCRRRHVHAPACTRCCS
jgi:hypothetical protein